MDGPQQKLSYFGKTDIIPLSVNDATSKKRQHPTCINANVWTP
jgi:hypothetical protein